MKPIIKVLIITARADYGGGPEHIFRLIKHLKEHVQFYVACPCDIPYWQKYADLIGVERMLKIPHRKFILKDFVHLLRFIKINQIKNVHSHGKGAGIYSRLAASFRNIHVIHTFHGIHYYKYGKLKKSISLLIEKVLAILTQKFIVVSESEKKIVLELGITKASKICVIPNGIEIGNEVVNYKNAADKKIDIVTITRFDFAKNPKLLIPIIEKLTTFSDERTIRIKTIGSGPGEEELKRIAEEKNLTRYITFIGAANNPKEHLMNSFCYISTSRSEGMPLGVLEAMSVGLPIVATKVAGNSDLIDHNKTGFLFDINKPDQAAEYILRLIEDETLWKEFSVSGRKKIEMNFNISKMVESTQMVYEKIDSGRNS